MADKDPLSHEGMKMWDDASSKRFCSQSSVRYRKKSPNAATAAGAGWTEPSYRANSVATLPTKKVKRSSGDILEATGEDGRVMPELLAEQGGAKWPRASSTTKILTFGASWDNRSDVDFLNKDVLDVDGAAKGAGLSLSASDAATKKGYVKGGAIASYRRRHSEPIPTTAVAALSPSAYAQGSSEGSPFLQSQGSPFLQSRALGPEGSSAVQALANTNKTNKRRAESTGGVGIVTREGTGAAFETFEAINSSFPAGSGANSMIATGLLVEGGGKESEMDRFLEEEEPSFQPEVDIVDIARMGMGLSASPAASVESGFWDDGEAGDEIVQALLGQNTNRSIGGGSSEDPKEAAHAALNRLIATCNPMSTSDTFHRDGSVNALENLLLDLQPHQGASLEAPAGVDAADGSLTEAKTHEHYTARLPVPQDIPVTPAGASNANKADIKTYEIKQSNPNPDSSRSGGALSSSPDGDDSTTSPGGDESSPSSGSSAAAALDPALWKLVERGDTCPFEGCAFTVQAAVEKERTKLGQGAAKAERVSATSVAFGAASSAVDSGRGSGEHQEDSGNGRLVDGSEGKESLTKNRSRCRHFHTLCGCRHTRGALKGLLFQTNQLDKARNHQKKHASAAAAISGATLATPSLQDPAGLTSSMSSGFVGVGTEDQDLSQVSQDTSRTLNSTLNSTGDYDDEEQSPDNSYDSLDLAELDVDVACDEEGYGLSASVGGHGKRKRRATKGVKEKSDRAKDGRRTWTDKESERLREAMVQQDAGEKRRNWTWVAARVSEAGGGRKTPSQCKMRWERIVNPDVKRGLWTKEEDDKLKQVAAAMDHKWSHVARLMGGRTYKQCRERYTNYLKEGLNCGPWTEEEEAVLLEMHSKFGNRWAEIARHLKDRSENMIKNQFMKLSRDACHKRKSWSDLGGDSDSGHCRPDAKKYKKRGRPKGVKNASDITTSKDGQSLHVSGKASVDDLDNSGAISVNDANIYCASNRNNASTVDIAANVGRDANIDTASYIYEGASSLKGGNASNSREICNSLV